MFYVYKGRFEANKSLFNKKQKKDWATKREEQKPKKCFVEDLRENGAL